MRGAALLLAMLIVTLVSTLAAAMVWQQWRAIEVEAAERARVQSAWLLTGALDWARLILREDARDGGPDGLTEPWAMGLEEIRLSTFLAADKNNNSAADATGLDAFLSGRIVDAQARYNLRNLLIGNTAEQARDEVAVLTRLCQGAGLGPQVAQQIVDGLRAAQQAEQQLAENPNAVATAGLPLRPQRLEQLGWLGLEPAVLQRLAPLVVLLPQRTAVNLNTASVEVLTAVVAGLDRASAQRLVEQRQTYKKGFEQLSTAQALLPERVKLDPRMVGTTTSHFEVTGQLRLEDNVLREVSLVQRRGLDVVLLRRDRLAFQQE